MQRTVYVRCRVKFNVPVFWQLYFISHTYFIYYWNSTVATSYHFGSMNVQNMHTFYLCLNFSVRSFFHLISLPFQTHYVLSKQTKIYCFNYSAQSEGPLLFKSLYIYGIRFLSLFGNGSFFYCLKHFVESMDNRSY